MAERAAEFAPDATQRTSCLLSALDRWLEAAATDGVVAEVMEEPFF